MWQKQGITCGHIRGAPYVQSLHALQNEGFASVLDTLKHLLSQYSAHQLKYIIGHPLHYFPSPEAFAEGGSV